MKVYEGMEEYLPLYLTSAVGEAEWSASHFICITASEMDPARIRRKAVWVPSPVWTLL
jgi:hypothetical protein